MTTISAHTDTVNVTTTGGKTADTSETAVEATAASIDGRLFFYKAATGDGAVGRLDAASQFQNLSVLSGFSAGWTHIVPNADGRLFFYKAATGDGAVGRLDAASQFQNLSVLSGFSAGWTHIV